MTKEEFYDELHRVVERDGVTVEDLSLFFGISIPSARRWLERKNAPHSSMRASVFRVLNIKESSMTEREEWKGDFKCLESSDEIARFVTPFAPGGQAVSIRLLVGSVLIATQHFGKAPTWCLLPRETIPELIAQLTRAVMK